jgi:hypothetical protein
VQVASPLIRVLASEFQLRSFGIHVQYMYTIIHPGDQPEIQPQVHPKVQLKVHP